MEVLEAKVDDLARNNPSTLSASPTKDLPFDRITNPRTSFDGSDPGRTQDCIEAGLVSLEKADSLLELYKIAMEGHFPFIVLSNRVAVHDLRRDKPFVFLAVLAAASYEDVKLQRALDKRFKQSVMQRMLLGGEVSFDLFQGLLVSCAWFVNVSQCPH